MQPLSIAAGTRVQRWCVAAVLVITALQLAVWLAPGSGPGGLVRRLASVGAWLGLLVLAVVVARRQRQLHQHLVQIESAHRTALTEVDALQLQNEMLQIIARAPDVPEAFQSLAPRLSRLVESDRLGLALLSEDGQEFQTFTARPPDAEDRRLRPLPEVVFRADGTALGRATRTCAPVLIDDTRDSTVE